MELGTIKQGCVRDLWAEWIVVAALVAWEQWEARTYIPALHSDGALIIYNN